MVAMATIYRVNFTVPSFLTDPLGTLDPSSDDRGFWMVRVLCVVDPQPLLEFFLYETMGDNMESMIIITFATYHVMSDDDLFYLVKL